MAFDSSSIEPYFAQGFQERIRITPRLYQLGNTSLEAAMQTRGELRIRRDKTDYASGTVLKAADGTPASWTFAAAVHPNVDATSFRWSHNILTGYNFTPEELTDLNENILVQIIDGKAKEEGAKIDAHILGKLNGLDLSSVAQGPQSGAPTAKQSRLIGGADNYLPAIDFASAFTQQPQFTGASANQDTVVDALVGLLTALESTGRISTVGDLPSMGRLAMHPAVYWQLNNRIRTRAADLQSRFLSQGSVLADNDSWFGALDIIRSARLAPTQVETTDGQPKSAGAGRKLAWPIYFVMNESAFRGMRFATQGQGSGSDGVSLGTRYAPVGSHPDDQLARLRSAAQMFWEATDLAGIYRISVRAAA